MTHRIHHTVRQIPAVDLPTVRDPGTGAARAATEAELLNMGMVPLGNDFYSCVEQERRDPETREWTPHGPTPPGEVVVTGADRYQRLPPEVRDQVLRARVIRSHDPERPSAVAIVDASIGEQSTRAAKLAEARRLVLRRDSGLSRRSVPVAAVDRTGDIVEEEGAEPHRWAGELLPRMARP